MIVSSGPDIEALRELIEAEAAAVNAGDLDAIMALRTDDFVSMPPNHPAVEGKPAARDFLGGILASFSPSDLRFDCTELAVCGDLGFVRGSFAWTVNPVDGGDPVEDAGKMIVITRRQEGGSWKLARVIWSSDSPG